MHIAYLTTEYPHSLISGRTGGIGTSIKYLASKLSEVNKVTVFVISQPENKFFKDGNVNIYAIKQKKTPPFTWLANALYANKKINQIIKKEKIQIIEIPDWGGIGALMQFRIPRVVRLNGSDTYFSFLENRKVKLKNYLLEKINLLKADEIVGVSKFVAEKTKELFRVNNNIPVIHNSVDVSFFKSTISSKIPRSILYFGTYIRKKGFLELAPIFNMINKKNPDVQFFFAGRDSIDFYEKKSTWEIFYNQLTPSTKSNVHNLGVLNLHQLKKIIDQVEVVVFPSYAEAFPLSWLEAMAMEKPIVASNIGWAKEMIEDEITGLLEYPANHSAYADKILFLLSNNDFAKKIGKNARVSVIKKFSSDVIAPQNILFYNNVIKKYK